jgi:hypothetical protein
MGSIYMGGMTFEEYERITLKLPGKDRMAQMRKAYSDRLREVASKQRPVRRSGKHEGK